MSELTWQTTEGSLGKYISYTQLAIQLFAESSDSSSIIGYKLLSGQLPIGTKRNPVGVDRTGLISGILVDIQEQTDYRFTIRAFDQYGSIKDRTFNITVTPSNIPEITTSPGSLFNILDSYYVSKNITYLNPDPSNIVTFDISSGNLPEGLYLKPDGFLGGYAVPPVTGAFSPTTQTSNFTVRLNSLLGNDSEQYSITIRNQNLLSAPHTRQPTILNTKPLQYPIQNSDPFYSFYSNDGVIPTVNANDYFTFKVIGHDFDGDELTYYYSSLPPGLTGDPDTGWITGTTLMAFTGINNFEFTVMVGKKNKPTIRSLPTKFYMTIVNNLVEDIVWTTPTNIGTIYNGVVSDLYVQATSSKTLLYSLKSGSLPPNLTLLDTGEIIGKVSFQPSTELLNENAETDFTFTVLTYSEQFPVLKSTKTFTLTVRQYFAEPVENIYFKATPNISGRTVLASLLNDTTLIPTNSLYRPQDSNFGKASNITVLQTYGLAVSTINEYLNVIQENFYTRKVVLGELKTAVARDDSNNIIYEVVYSEIVDDLVNKNGISIPMRVRYPYLINLDQGPWMINNTDIYASYSDVSGNDYYTSLTPGYDRVLYPASLNNMTSKLTESIQQTTDKVLLPKWMTSQQRDGNVLGYVRGWVICYTKPNESETIKNNINNNWAHTLNEIDFTIDRFIVDKTNTFNYNTNLSVPAWNEFPGATPVPTTPDEYDLVVVFPKENISPKSGN